MKRVKVSMPIQKMYWNTESKAGKKYDTPRITVYTDESLVDDKTFTGMVSCFDDGRRTGEWKEGMDVDVTLERKDVGDATYWNIVFPSQLELRVDDIEKRLLVLEEHASLKKADGKKDLPF